MSLMLIALCSCNNINSQKLISGSVGNTPISSGVTTVDGSLIFSGFSNYDFGNRSIDSISSATLTLTASGSSSSHIDHIFINSPFAVSGGTCASGIILSSNQNCTLNIYFQPSQIGVYSSVLNVDYSIASASQSVSFGVSATVGTPALSFALMDSNDSTTQFNQYLDMASVDGIAVRLSWDSLQPTSATFVWTKINEAFNAAKLHNKKVSLHILSSVYGNTPSWVYASGGVSYTYVKPGTGVTKTDPLPWDSTYLSKWSNFLNSLSSYLSAQNYLNTLEFISIGAISPEMSLVACVNSDINGTSAGYTSGSYNKTSYLNAWKSSVSATVNAFPNKKLLLPAPIQHICFPDNDGSAFYVELFNYAKSLSADKIYHYATDLNSTASGSVRLSQIPRSPTNIYIQAPAGLQYTWSYSQDNGLKLGGSLKKATCDFGFKVWNSSYFEVYKNDLDSASATTQSVIQNIHEPWNCN